MSEPLSSHAVSSPAASHQVMLQQASRQSPTSTPPPPPITLNPPSQQADTSASSTQLNPSLHHHPSVSRTLLHTLRPPRSSSLQGTSSSGQRPSSPSPGPGSAAAYAPHRDHSRAPPVSLKQRPSTPSSQIEKANLTGLSPREGSRARNRWSTSTISSTSSRTSPFATRRTAGSPNRRASFEVSGVRGSPPLVRQSSQRLLQGRLPPLFANHNTPVTVETGQLGAPGVAQPAVGYHGANHQRGASPGPSTSAGKTLPETRMPYDQGREAHPNRGHSRERSGKGSQDSGKRGQKPPSQKAMLSRALQKANAAVQLDNAQNLEGARGAYAEACQLLQHVLQRTTADEDRRKLEVIQQTYTSRIAELDQMGPWQQDTTKALPARPESEEYMRDIYAYYAEFSGAMPKTNPTNRASLMGESSNSHGRQAQVSSPPQRPANGSPQDISSERRPSYPSDSPLPPSAFPVRTSSGRRPREDPSRLAPAPLASARSISPVRLRSDDIYDAHEMRGMGHDPQSPTSEGNPGRFGQRISQDGGSASWLDPIDESGGSVMNSPHSRRSSMGFHRRHNRMTSGNTEAEFDSALDAAIEAAYNDNFEYGGRGNYGSPQSTRDSIMGAYGAAETGRESKASRKRDSHYGMRSVQAGRRDSIQEDHEPGGFYEDDSSDEERILEEITRDFAIEDFTMGQQLRPVKEDWMSSVLETDIQADFHPLLSMPGPSSLMAEQLPAPDLSQAPILSLPQPPLAGHNRQASEARSLQLTIETTNLGAAKPIAMTALKRQSSVSTTGKSEVASIAESVRATSVEERSTSSSSLVAAATEGAALPELAVMTQRATGSDDGGSLHAPASPPFSKLRKKFSSSSLRSVKGRNISMSNLEEVADKSPTLPTTQQQPLHKPPVPALPVGLAHTLMASYRDHVNVSIAGGLHLFEQFPQANEPGSPTGATSNAPVPLEPCPADLCLRPFWLMRCLFQTLVHPRGGYLSSKLFVPRDVWRTRGVKLKNLEEKIAQCDYLTAALLKLGKANPLDADALLVEMQEFESVVEHAQQVLARKLGNDVGAQHSGFAPKEGSGAADGDGGSHVPRSASVSGKQSSFSWRRLRSKPSTIGLGGSSSSRTGADGMRENSNVPMTAKPTSRPVKRDLSHAQFVGPNATYMASLAHLFDAAQTLDEIARQVEDPGLKHADKTQVGLELGTRHAAEFFGFYVCRFVLADLSLLLDKFLKRGSEWVLT